MLLLFAVTPSGWAQDTSERPVIEGQRAVTLAPDEPTVLFSYLDDNLAPYVSHVELIDVETFARCLAEGLSDCEQRGESGIYRLPLHLDTDAEDAKAAIDTGWQWFFDAVVTRVHTRLNAFPPPWNPLAPCGSHINWPEVFRRQLEAVIETFAEDQPVYWQEVVAALLTHVPLSLWWEGPFPLQQGAVLTAITSIEPKSAQIARLFEEPRDRIYHLQPYTAGLPLPYTPDELALPLYPGLEEKEIAKGGNVPGEGLEPATVPEQAQFGYGNFFLTWGGFEDTWFMTVWGILPVPSIVASVCLIPYPPFFAVVPFIPVPTFVPQVPRAFYGDVSVPEGYALPRLVGSPLWVLPDLNLVLPPTPTQLPLQLIPDPDWFPEPVPCLPWDASWPPPGYEQVELGPVPEVTCPESTPLAPMKPEPRRD